MISVYKQNNMKKKTLLITGASGFLGSNIKTLLSENYRIETIGLSEEDDIRVNLAHATPKISKKYDVILHAAGKAHMEPKSDKEKKSFFEVNLQGTINLCNSLEKSGLPESFIFISSVAVYGLEYGELITEDFPANPKTAYGVSKFQAELFLQKWCKIHGVKLGIIRPSLIAGPNPPGNLGAMINGIKSGKYLSINGGAAKKSVLMVDDIARLVPLLEKKSGIYNVCDSKQPTFRELEKVIACQLHKSTPKSIPYPVAKVLAKFGDYLGHIVPINSNKLTKITVSLTFSNEKARKELGWEPLKVVDNFRIS